MMGQIQSMTAVFANVQCQRISLSAKAQPGGREEALETSQTAQQRQFFGPCTDYICMWKNGGQQGTGGVVLSRITIVCISLSATTIVPGYNVTGCSVQLQYLYHQDS